MEDRDKLLIARIGYISQRPAEGKFPEALEREVTRLAEFLGLEECAYILEG